MMNPCVIVDLWQFFRAGLSHPELGVRRHFQKSIMLARRATAEGGDDNMVTAALLNYPCHMLASRSFTSEAWSSDSIIESGTLDWIVDNFGEVVAEVIRLQPHARRYFASISRPYLQQLDSQERSQMAVDGGEMSRCAAIAFARGRFFSQAMQLARWINQTLDQNHGVPDIDEVDATAGRLRSQLGRNGLQSASSNRFTPRGLELPIK